MLSNAKLYSEHRSMQHHDSDVFFETVVKRMDWSRVEQDVVMDVGCGPGNFCKKTFLAHYPGVKKVLGVDVLPDMIDFARKNNADDRIEYYVADMEDRKSMETWQDQMTKILSVYCFNWLSDHKEAFHIVHDLLKAGGEAAMVFVLTTPFWDSYQVHYRNPKWSKYLQNSNAHVPESHFEKHDAAFYRSLLRDVGFTVLLCEDEKRSYAYAGDDDARDALFTTALTGYIPDELKSEFKEDIFKAFLEYNPRNSEGKPVLYYTSLTLHVQKPSA